MKVASVVDTRDVSRRERERERERESLENDSKESQRANDETLRLLRVTAKLGTNCEKGPDALVLRRESTQKEMRK